VDMAFAARIEDVVYARMVECFHGLPLEWWEMMAVPLPAGRTSTGKVCHDMSQLLEHGQLDSGRLGVLSTLLLDAWDPLMVAEVLRHRRGMRTVHE
jgi:hypothetical protein